MYVQEVVIDGFKSYAHRTVVEGFDSHFNAITGLNGSGKSNILDSICFVLGITNLSQVRAGNLSELVYKQGQAGVNKASVTIVFNNEDPNCSPVGYEQCKEVTVTRQVLIGGKSKYLINGRNSPAGQVVNLFHSVQLNVNNPHFLIMQGRITKVLNMKPNEILGMVEEAAGTRMYETKRIAAIKTIDKKQSKVDEINSILTEEITPTLERLRGEKQNYLKWSKNNADIERIQRFVIASDYMKAKTTIDTNSAGVTEMQEQISVQEHQIQDYQQQIQQKEQQMEELSSKLNNEYQEQLTKYKTIEENHSKQLVKVTSTWQNCKDVVKKAQMDIKAAKELVVETNGAVASKQEQIEQESIHIQQQKQAASDAEQTYQQLTLDYQNMSAGISSSQGDEGRTLPDQISKAHSDSKIAESKSKQAKMKITHLSKEIKSIEKEMKKTEKETGKLSSQRDKCQQKVESIKEKINQLGFSDEEFNALEKQKNQLETSIADLKEIIDTLSAQIEGRLRFKYSDPVRGFDRSKVKGMVAKLIEVQDSKHTTALEVVAGGKLYQVVVEDAITGKALLDKGKLERRVTIIPLDKIRPRQLTNAVTQRASNIAQSQSATAYPAIQLVGYEEDVRHAMEYVFGSTIVVDNSKTANDICDTTKTRTVTLDGDVYDPSGTISGGSKNQLGTTLLKLTELTAATKQHQIQENQYKTIIAEYNSMQNKNQAFEEYSSTYEIMQTELNNYEQHLSQTSYGVHKERYDSMKSDLNIAQQEYTSMEQEKKEKWDLYHQLQEREVELTQQREKRLKDIEKAVKDAKQKVAKTSKLAREAESRSQTLDLELQSLKAEVNAGEDAVRAAEKLYNEAVSDEQAKEVKVAEMKGLYDQSKNELDKIEQEISNCSKELKQCRNEKVTIVKAKDKIQIQIKELSIAITRIQKEYETAEKYINGMLQQHTWIKSEQAAFGLPGGDYDFEAMNPNEMKEQLQFLKGEQESLSKKINKKVMGMIEKAEGEYTELLRKRKVIENDKKKIQAVIEELDIKKKSELERTWEKVNNDFGSIFSTLLPGTNAKLEPPEGMAAWEGLEVKVAFGNVWKESLSELSGGQRSLLALSLILSLLLFKPAPMYILDEVDAALDLSHTQNIGNMLKTHFSQSQFIVVSLKEGMFNNANVIFRTKFVDGVSTVTRTIGNGSTKPAAAPSSRSERPFASSSRNRNAETGISSTRKAAAGTPSRRSNKGKENMEE